MRVFLISTMLLVSPLSGELTSAPAGLESLCAVGALAQSRAPVDTLTQRPAGEPHFVWVLASTPDQEEATRLVARFNTLAPEVRMLYMPVNDTHTYRVVAGRYRTPAEASRARQRVFGDGTPQDAWLLRIEPVPASSTAADPAPEDSSVQQSRETAFSAAEPLPASAAREQLLVADEPSASVEEPTTSQSAPQRAPQSTPAAENVAEQATPRATSSDQGETSRAGNRVVAETDPDAIGVAEPGSEEHTGEDDASGNFNSPAETPIQVDTTATEREEPFESYHTWVVATFNGAAQAQQLAQRYRRMGFDAVMLAMPSEDQAAILFHVTVGRYQSQADAEQNRKEDVPLDAPASTWLLAVQPR